MSTLKRVLHAVKRNKGNKIHWNGDWCKDSIKYWLTLFALANSYVWPYVYTHIHKQAASKDQQKIFAIFTYCYRNMIFMDTEVCSVKEKLFSFFCYKLRTFELEERERKKKIDWFSINFECNSTTTTKKKQIHLAWFSTWP